MKTEYTKNFEAVWNVIKEWDIERSQNEGYAGATGTDVETILKALNCDEKDKEIERLKNLTN